jgi:hypothetical protein
VDHRWAKCGGADGERDGVFCHQPGGARPVDRRSPKVRADIVAAMRKDPNLPGGLIQL